MSTFDPCGSRTLSGGDILIRLAAELGVSADTLRDMLHSLLRQAGGDGK